MEIADGADNVLGKPENPGERGVFPEGDQVDLVVPADDPPVGRDQESAVVVSRLGPFAVESRRTEEDRGAHLLRKVQDSGLVSGGSWKKKGTAVSGQMTKFGRTAKVREVRSAYI